MRTSCILPIKKNYFSLPLVGRPSNTYKRVTYIHTYIHLRPHPLRIAAKEFFDVVVSRVQSSQTSPHSRCIPADNFAIVAGSVEASGAIECRFSITPTANQRNIQILDNRMQGIT